MKTTIGKRVTYLLIPFLAISFNHCSERYQDISLEDNFQDDIISGYDTNFWGYRQIPQIRSEFIKRFLDRLEISIWHTIAEGDNKPSYGELGSFGIGNGSVFGFTGLAYPLNTLHSLCGPYYEKHDRFFGDISIELYSGDEKIPFENEYVLRSISGPINIIIEESKIAYIEILDFTPILPDEDNILKRNYIRVISIKNISDGNSLSLRLHTANPQKYNNQILLEEKEDATLSTLFLDDDQNDKPFYENNIYGIRMENLKRDEERVILLIHHITDGADKTDDEVNYLREHLDVESALDETLKNYAMWNKQTMKITTPDIAVNDLIEGLKLTLKTQIGENGAAAPMSEYTRVWTRDLSGWVLGLLSIGDFDDVRQILKYLFYAIKRGGDIANSYPADLDTDTQVDEPDWESLPPLSGKAAVEGPSYIPIYHHLYYEYTGDKSLFNEQYRLLSRALIKQNISEKGLLSFSGDETYRAAMNAAFGMPLEYPHHTNSYSPNSSILYIRAAKGIESLFINTLDPETVNLFEERLSLVENAFYDNFILENGCISAFIDISNGKAFERPFEDEALSLSFWNNIYFDANVARNNLNCLLDKIHTGPGVLLSSIDPKYRDFLGIRVRKGILTGMLPGYTLAALTENNHPEAEDAFNEMGKYADTSGNFGEYLIYDNRQTLSLIYDANGKQGDYTARFRPWEGGINLYSIIDYLIGLRISPTDNKLRFRPHLPNNWQYLEATNIRFLTHHLDLKLSRNGDRYTIEILCNDENHLSIEIVIDYPRDRKIVFDNHYLITTIEGSFEQDTAIIRLERLNKGSNIIQYRLGEKQ